tara:strand:+ start:398 stop:613 length:216 start_codon:yes stop_codon:yes gene_type:complete
MLIDVCKYKKEIKMEKAIKNLSQTIKEIEWEILQCYDDNKLPYLQRAKKEAIICLTTLRDVRIYDILTNKN